MIFKKMKDYIKCFHFMIIAVYLYFYHTNISIKIEKFLSRIFHGSLFPLQPGKLH